MSAVGEVMTRFQKVVTAVGAARANFREVRGRFPAEVVERTRLQLVASPYVGSVVLDFMPRVTPREEFYPNGTPPMVDEPRTQEADEAVAAVVDLFAAAGAIPPDADGAEFLASVSNYGPRVATALRDLLARLGTNRFETDLVWREPGRPTRRAILQSADAERAKALIVSRELDHGETTIEGVIHTVSDSTSLVVVGADGEPVYINPRNLSPQQLSGIAYNSLVRVVVDVLAVEGAGGDSVVKYFAKSIQTLDPS